MKHAAIWSLILVIALAGPAAAASLPADHAYQEELHRWLAGLKEEDLTIQIQEFRPPREQRSVQELYRLWTLRLRIPPADLHAPAAQFLLKSIEAEEAITLPSISCSGTAWLAQWDDPINPYYGNKALKRRALVWASVDLMMLDQWHAQGKGRRSDFLGGTLIWLAYVYKAAADVMPEPARRAYATGLRRMVDKLQRWGPTGIMTDMDLFAPVGLWYAAEGLNDPEMRQIAEQYSRPLFTAPRFFHPAGYFVDVGAYDVSYNGISLYFAAHAAVATRWDFAVSALSRAYELRRYLVFPEPTGGWWGPSHFSPRTSAGAAREQWGRRIRHVTAAMFTDHALGSAPLMTREELEASAERLVAHLQRLNRPRTRKPQAWKERHWSSDLPYAYDHYVPGLYERRKAIQEKNPQMLMRPFARPDTFIRNFGDVLFCAKTPSFGLIIHTGPIGSQKPRLYGFSGGALSGFWTPRTGPVLLGRRSGAQGHAKPDDWSNWEMWPTHATTGINPQGRTWSVARVRKPNVQHALKENAGTITVTGVIRNGDGAMPRTLEGPIDYRRTFTLAPGALTIETVLKAEKPQPTPQLYEILPVFYGPRRGKRPELVQSITLLAGKEWVPLTTELQSGSAIRIARSEGVVEVRLDRNRPVKLSREMWADQYQSRVRCRSIMIDLLTEPGGRKEELKASTVSYRIAPVQP